MQEVTCGGPCSANEMHYSVLLKKIIIAFHKNVIKRTVCFDVMITHPPQQPSLDLKASQLPASVAGFLLT